MFIQRFVSPVRDDCRLLMSCQVCNVWVIASQQLDLMLDTLNPVVCLLNKPTYKPTHTLCLHLPLLKKRKFPNFTSLQEFYFLKIIVFLEALPTHLDSQQMTLSTK